MCEQSGVIEVPKISGQECVEAVINCATGAHFRKNV